MGLRQALFVGLACLVMGQAQAQRYSGGGGGGLVAATPALFSGAMSALPTMANTGLTNLLGSGASVANSTAGVLLLGNSGMGAYTTAIPATPYSVTVLLAATQNQSIAAIGWTDGTKLEYIGTQKNSNLLVLALNNITTFNSTPFSAFWGLNASLIWLKIRDDGTNVFFMASADGVNFFTAYSVAKSAGFLGAAGYSHIFVGSPGGSAAEDVTVMSWAQGQ